MKLVQYNEYLVNTVDTDGLVLHHQGISSHSAEYTPAVYGLIAFSWFGLGGHHH